MDNTPDITAIRNIIDRNITKTSFHNADCRRIDADIIYGIHTNVKRNIYFVDDIAYDDEEFNKTFPEVAASGMTPKDILQRQSVELDPNGEPLTMFPSSAGLMGNPYSSKIIETNCYIADDDWKSFKRVQTMASDLTRFKDKPMMLEYMFGGISGTPLLLTSTSAETNPSTYDINDILDNLDALDLTGFEI